MVFGWPKKKKPEKYGAEYESQEKQIPLSQVKDVVQDIHILKTKTLVSEIKSFRNKIIAKLDEISKLTKRLEDTDLKVDDVERHLKILVIRGKKQVVSIVKKETAIQLPEIESYDNAIKLQTELNSILKRIGDVLGKQTRVIHIFAKKYALKLKSILSSLNSDKEQIQILLNNYDNFAKNSSEIFENLKTIEESNQTLNEKSERIEQLRKAIEQYQKTIESAKEDINKLKSTHEYSKYLEIRKKIESLSAGKHQIQSHLDMQFTKLSRPLSKYGYISSLEKPQKKLIQTLLSDPFGALVPKNKDIIITILESVRRGVESGSVSVKDTEKSVRTIDQTLDMLDGFVNQVKGFLDKKKELTEELGRIDIEELKHKESSIGKAQMDISDTESKINYFENEISEAKKLIDNQLMDVEIRLKNISAIKYHITSKIP